MSRPRDLPRQALVGSPLGSSLDNLHHRPGSRENLNIDNLTGRAMLRAHLERSVDRLNGLNDNWGHWNVDNLFDGCI